MKTNQIQGYYGSGNTPCSIFTAETRNGGTWYAVEGSSNVNFTFEPVELGVNVEELDDADYFNWPAGIDSEETLIEAIEA